MFFPKLSKAPKKYLSAFWGVAEGRPLLVV
jgi:hypothetical protein